MDFDSIKIEVNSRLKELVDIPVYNLKAVPIYPATELPNNYIVYKFPPVDLRTNASCNNRMIEIDYWSRGTDDSTIMEASKLVKDGLNFYSSPNSRFRSFLQVEGELVDPDPTVSRYHQEYWIKDWDVSI